LKKSTTLVRNKKHLNEEQVKEIFSLITEENITMDLIKDLLVTRRDSPAKYSPNDTFDLPAKKLYNDKAIVTTVGKYLVNQFLLMPNIIKHTGYINRTLDKGGIGFLEDSLAELLLTDKITTNDYIDYIDKAQWLGFAPSFVVSPGYGYDIVVPLDTVNKRKEELIKKHEQSLKDNDPVAATAIERELTDLAEEELRLNDVMGMDYFDSGTSKGFGNNYKNMSIMRGSMPNNSEPGKFHVTTSNLMDGIDKEEFYKYADLTVLASHSRAIGTQKGGYVSKQLNASFQTLMLDDKGTDCGTRMTIPFELTKGNKGQFLYRYIKEGDKTVLLDKTNVDSYIGKSVEFRTPMYCTSEKICNKCAGELYYMLGIKNTGLLSARVGSSLMNMALKKFHDTTLKYNEIKIDNFIEE
jgi:hypothetical protein